MEEAIGARETEVLADRAPRPPRLLPALRLPTGRGDLRRHEQIRGAAGGLDGARATRLQPARPRRASLRRSLRLTRPVGPRLGAVPARAHRAPRARVVAGEVVERPVAIVPRHALSRSHVPSASATATIASTRPTGSSPVSCGAPSDPKVTGHRALQETRAERRRRRRPPLCASSTPRSASRHLAHRREVGERRGPSPFSSSHSEDSSSSPRLQVEGVDQRLDARQLTRGSVDPNRA